MHLSRSVACSSYRIDTDQHNVRPPTVFEATGVRGPCNTIHELYLVETDILRFKKVKKLNKGPS